MMESTCIVVNNRQLKMMFYKGPIVYSNTEMSLKEELVYTPEEGSSQPVLISRSSMVLKSD